jgi:hypothetical protein
LHVGIEYTTIGGLYMFTPLLEEERNIAFHALIAKATRRVRRNRPGANLALTADDHPIDHVSAKILAGINSAQERFRAYSVHSSWDFEQPWNTLREPLLVFSACNEPTTALQEEVRCEPIFAHYKPDSLRTLGNKQPIEDVTRLCYKIPQQSTCEDQCLVVKNVSERRAKHLLPDASLTSFSGPFQWLVPGACTCDVTSFAFSTA